eukprot:m.186829 g.186829  ORF g.186829 m.186829 type:complete len:322 (+) comp14763_c0_seq3:309-1274(+)
MSTTTGAIALRMGLFLWFGAVSIAVSIAVKGAEAHCPVYGGAPLFYNRIPKAGSSSLKTIVHDLSRIYKYKQYSYPVYDDRDWFDQEKESQNAARISSTFVKYGGRVVYDQHIRFINFTKFDLDQPYYFNLMRHPVSRAISTYYFARTGGHSQREKIRERLGAEADWSITKCALASSECKFMRSTSSFHLMTAFFCGHHEECQVINATALARAKNNLKQSYAFVGITEHFLESVAVLGKMFPQYFGHVLELLIAQGEVTNKNKNHHKGNQPDEATIAILEEKTKYDLELYHYAVSLFKEHVQNCLTQLDYDIMAKLGHERE